MNLKQKSNSSQSISSEKLRSDLNKENDLFTIFSYFHHYACAGGIYRDW